MRPNLFANTPDILPEYLQRGGRPAFEVRLVLAATLGATYGIYSGFELCENRPVARGSEEYLDSEKYQVQAVGLEPARPHHAVDRTHQPDAARASRAPERLEPAVPPHRQRPDHLLQQGDRRPLGRPAGGRQSGSVPDAARLRRIAGDDWGLDAAGYSVEDLLSGERYFWRGDVNYVRLDPGHRAAHVLLVQRRQLPRPPCAGRSRKHQSPSPRSTRSRPDAFRTACMDDDRPWYKDAIIYELHVRAFCRQHRRRRRRLRRTDQQARLPAGARRHVPLAAPVLSVAAQG